MRVICQPNRGVAAARNTGFAAAAGQFMAILDADDFLFPGYLEHAVRAWQAAASTRALVTTEAYLLTPGGVWPDRTMLKFPHSPAAGQRMAILASNFVAIFTLFPRALLDEVGPMDESLRLAEDWDLWIKAVYAGWEVVRQPVPMALYRWTGLSLSTQREGMYAAEDRVLRGVWDRESPTMSESERTYLQRRLRDGSPRRHFSEGEDALRAGRYPDAHTHFVRAAQLSPGDRKMQLRAQLSAFRPTARLLAKRLDGVDAQTGYHEDMRH